MKTMTRAILAASALFSILAGCTPPDRQAASNPNTPGGTGLTVVPGSGSSVAGAAAATDRQQKWGSGSPR